MPRPAQPSANPFPGLRPFESDQNHLFFGRDGQSDELVRRLRQRRFLAVVGASGSGKSSLVRAGLLPALDGGFMPGAGSIWRKAIFRPGGDPIGTLAGAVDEAFSGPGEAFSGPGEVRSVEESGSGQGTPRGLRLALLAAVLRRGSLGLVDAVRQARLEPRENLLVVVDQFEELFRFRRASALAQPHEEATAFVRLLLESARQQEETIFVVLTMRSDFLGECAQFRDLPEALNGGQYLIPRMTRDHRREAIEGPVAVGGATFTPRLVQRLLNDAGDDPDQLPILQHALMRTFDHWTGRSSVGPIDLEDYEAIGGMTEALSRHADEAYQALTPAGQRIAEWLFRCLTEKGADNRELRRPTRFGSACEIAQASAAETEAVIDAFRSESRTFLMPPQDTALEAGTLLDISHESLIRLWTRLRSWVEEEARSRAAYVRLLDAAERRRSGDGGLWRDRELQRALEWRSGAMPHRAWAELYGGAFDLAVEFLEDSRRDWEAEVRARGRKRAYRWMGAAGVVGIALALVMGFLAMSALRQRSHAIRAADNARHATLIAKHQGAEAKHQRAEAEHQRAEAERQRAEAERQRAEAERQRAEAERQRDEAIKQQRIAAEQTKRTDDALEALLAVLKPSIVRLSVEGVRGYYANGFFASSRGHVITAGHAVETFGNKPLRLRTWSGEVMPARLLAIDKKRDLALLMAEPSGPVEALPLADGAVKGSTVAALGYWGLDTRDEGWFPTSGTVSDPRASLTALSTGGETVSGDDLVKVALQIQPGFSGAPVVNLDRKVIGIVAYGEMSRNVNYLIPASRIRAAFGRELSGEP